MPYKDPEKAKENCRKWYAKHKHQEQPKHRQWHHSHKPSAKRHARQKRLASYGLTEFDYNRMCDAQGFVCLICGWVIEDTSGKAKTLAVDHKHSTRQVRGLLCRHCNTGLGMFKDSVTLLRKAAAYLEHFEFIEATEGDQ